MVVLVVYFWEVIEMDGSGGVVVQNKDGEDPALRSRLVELTNIIRFLRRLIIELAREGILWDTFLSPEVCYEISPDPKVTIKTIGIEVEIFLSGLSNQNNRHVEVHITTQPDFKSNNILKPPKPAEVYIFYSKRIDVLSTKVAEIIKNYIEKV